MKQPLDDPLPNGTRQDARWRTKHPLRPTEAIVKEFLAAYGDTAWGRFRNAYLDLLERWFREDRTAFDRLAQLAKTSDVFLGCNGPAELNPRVKHCHTFLALQFMKRKYPFLDIRMPKVRRWSPQSPLDPSAVTCVWRRCPT